MFISKVTFKRGPGLFKLLKQKNSNDGYLAHQILWSLFPNDGDKRRDFLFCKNEKTDLPQYFIVSKIPPVSTGGVIVDIKPYTPQLEEGQRLAFSLIANPVVSRKVEGKKHSVKHDIWMDAKDKARTNGADKDSIFHACEDASKKWLIEQGEKRGFFVENNYFVVDGYIQNRIYNKKQEQPIRFSSIRYEGILTVTDTAKFTSTLYNGIGRAKAFGCGLMLVKRI